ncbi:hypothetical protein ACFV9C_26095 [Kribbella sp. NPDC059898]|uniref:hypothetical protein n=1 Tax=Kribbella sp. NPDC059898 TaxID=3346995 RepID=UPI003666DC88
MNCGLSYGKWPVAVEHLYQSSNLPELVPPGEVRQVQRELNRAMRAPFHSLTELETVMPVAVNPQQPKGATREPHQSDR